MQNKRLEKYQKIVKNKYQIYNSLFTSLPFDEIANLGMLLPFLYKESVDGYNQGKTPKEIMNRFFEKHTDLSNEKDKIDLLFHLVQYIERQVVLFDSIEESAAAYLHPGPDSVTLNQLYQMAGRQGKTEEVKQKLADYAIRIVFTAHPTQFYTNSVQRIIHDLREAVKEDSVSKIDTLLIQLAKTPFLKEEKPTPYDEAMSIVYYLRYFYYDAIGELYDQMSDLFFKDGEQPNSPVIQLGFWPGGDRDGNPFVTADITLKVANQLRISVLKSYYNHLKFLRRRLTFKGVDKEIEQLSDRIYENMFRDTSDIHLNEIQESIERMKKNLVEEHNGVFMNSLKIFENRVKLFGLHFATLDIRQDSRIHQKVINAMIQHAEGVDFQLLSDEEKIKILTKKEHNLNWEDFDEPIVQDTIKNVKQLKYIQEQNGEMGVHRYIISNSETIYDVLNVYALFKYCGYKDDEIHFDIMPLFETIRGLSNAEQTMQTLYDLPVYAKHLENRSMKQGIMLGFSDGTKDGGYLKANWEIYRTKETLTGVSERNGIKVIFFDGRGGPPARGGGKTHKFYAAQGKTVANNELQLTIQGQTITSMFGNKIQAKHNFEQLLTAGVLADIFNGEANNMTSPEVDLMNQLADLSYEKYSNLKAHEKFVPYLEQMSTLKYYGKTNIGSRPSKRGGGDKLEFSNLRAIPFVGSWSLLKQNVPGYFGVGTAIKELENRGKLTNVKELYQSSKFFRALILNSMMSLQKTYFSLTSYMKENPEFGGFWQILKDEYELSKEMTLKISGFTELMENEEIDKESIIMRDKIVLPLLTIQQYALELLQAGTDNQEVYEKLVTRSLFGNINASRNSA